MNIPWDLIIEAVLELIKDCLDQESEPLAIRKRISEPGAWDMLRLRRGLRQQGLSGRELREAMAAARKASNSVPDDMLEELIDEARVT